MRRIGFGLALCVTLSLVWVYAVDSGSERAGSDSQGGHVETAAVPCLFSEQPQSAFALSHHVEALDEDGSSSGVSDRFEAVLSTRQAGDGLVYAGLSEVAFTQQLGRTNDQVQHPLDGAFSFRVATDCRLQDLRLPADWSPAAAELVTGIMRGFEIVIEEGEHWNVRQQDGIGRYHATYRRGPDLIVRRKLYYEQSAAEFGLELRQFEAVAHASLDAEGVSAVEGSERLQMLASGAVRADLRGRYSLHRATRRYRNPVLAGELVAEASLLDASPSSDHPVEVPSDFEAAHAQYLRLVPRMGRTLSMTDARTLAALLKQHPALVRSLAERLWTDDIDDRERASIFWVLELTGTDAARDVIVSGMDAPRVNDRIRAAIALSGVTKPSLETGRLLLELRENDPDARVADAALLNLGSLARDGDRAVQGFVRETLGHALDDASSSAERLVVLGAIGNSSDASFVESVGQHLTDEDPAIRGKAARVIAKLGSDGKALLKEAFETEDDGRAARAQAEALSRGAAANDEDVLWVAEQLSRSGSEHVRAELIRWLGDSNSAAADEVLATHFHAEPSGRLKQLIGTFLPASSLRSL